MWRERIKGDTAVDVVDTGLSPLDFVDGFKIRPGFFRMNGAYETSNGVSFTINSHGAHCFFSGQWRKNHMPGYHIRIHTE